MAWEIVVAVLIGKIGPVNWARFAVFIALGLLILPALAVAQDGDGDMVPDIRDNCVSVVNTDQGDADLDGMGTRCDPDYENDNFVQGLDFGVIVDAISTGVGALADHDGNGAVSGSDFAIFVQYFGKALGASGLACSGSIPCKGCPFRLDLDADFDGIVDALDNCPRNANGPSQGAANQTDTDSDGLGNMCDVDFNNDGLIDHTDVDIFVNSLTSPPGLPATDVDGDGTMTITDYELLQANFPEFFQDEDGWRPPNSPSACTGLSGLDRAAWRDAFVISPTAEFNQRIRVVRGTAYAGSLVPSGFTYPQPLDVGLTAKPTAGTFKLLRRDVKDFSYTAQASTTKTTDKIGYVLSDGYAVSPERNIDFVIVPGGAGHSYSTSELNDKVLVVYNSNAAGGLELAQYYANARGIPATRLCPVTMPKGLYASKDQMLVVRKQIVRDCICPLVPTANRPNPCDVGPNLEALAQVSPVSHLALIRGMPARLTDTGFPGAGMDAGAEEEPSLDYYLAYLLYRNVDLFCPGCPGPMQSVWGLALNDFTQALSGAGSILNRGVVPARDRFVVYGRVEALNVDSTKRLIDRTLAAEAAGFQGNILSETQRGHAFALHTVGGTASACRSYSTAKPFVPGGSSSTWPYATCRAGTTDSKTAGAVDGLMPGSFQSHIPVAVNAGYFIGDDPITAGPVQNGQNGFNSFGTLLNWRVTGASCTALCKDLPTAQQAACRQSSNDYFRELNSDCVGVAPGFIGQQARSFPVGYFGFYPPGWLAGDVGGIDHSIPEIRQGGAYSDAVFSDDGYLHLGSSAFDQSDTSQCAGLSGASSRCIEKVAVHLMSTGIVFNPALVVNPNRTFGVTIRHRNKANAVGILRVEARFFNGTSLIIGAASSTIPLNQSSGATWQTDTRTISISSSQIPQVDKIQLIIRAELEDGIEEYLDLDAIELIDSSGPSQQNLLPLASASFNPALHDQTHLGDAAANAIDRLGGVAFWGSSSHHRTSGKAFASPFTRVSDIMRRHQDGLSLAESVIANGSAESGILYGDPLFRGSIVSLQPLGNSNKARPSSALSSLPTIEEDLRHPGQVVTLQTVASHRKATLSVLHGTANTATTQWSLSICPMRDLIECDQQSLWTQKEGGTGAVIDRSFDWVQFLSSPTVNQNVMVRLKVWNPGQEDRALYDYLYYDYRPI